MPRTPQPSPGTPASIDSANRDLIEEFVAQADAGATTIAKYRAQLTECAIWMNHPKVCGDPARQPLSLVDATQGQLQRFMSYLMAGDRFAGPERAQHGRPLSASSRKSFLASLRTFYRYLVAVEIVTTDPTLSIRAPKVRIHPGFRLSAEELRQLLDAPGTPRERVQTYLLVYTAARAGELRTLHWDDIDFPGRTLTLHGKNDKYHTVDIHPKLMSELRRWFVHQEHVTLRNEAVARARAHPDTDFVLLTSRGRQLSQTAIYKQLKRRASIAGLYVLDPAHREYRSRVSPHALRRSIATLLLNEGHPIDAVADVLHHEQVDTTRKHYAFSSNARRRATIEAINI